MAYTYEDLTRDMRQAALLLAAIDEHYNHIKWSVKSLSDEADYLERHTDPEEEVED